MDCGTMGNGIGRAKANNIPAAKGAGGITAVSDGRGNRNRSGGILGRAVRHRAAGRNPGKVRKQHRIARSDQQRRTQHHLSKETGRNPAGSEQEMPTAQHHLPCDHRRIFVFLRRAVGMGFDVSPIWLYQPCQVVHQLQRWHLV